MDAKGRQDASQYATSRGVKITLGLKRFFTTRDPRLSHRSIFYFGICSLCNSFFYRRSLLVTPVILYHESVFNTQLYPRHLQYTPDPKGDKHGRARADPTLLLLTPIRGPLMRPIHIFLLPPDTPHLPLRFSKGPRRPSSGEIFTSTTIHTL